MVILRRKACEQLLEAPKSGDEQVLQEVATTSRKNKLYNENSHVCTAWIFARG